MTCHAYGIQSVALIEEPQTVDHLVKEVFYDLVGSSKSKVLGLN